jgi:Esterase/lipase
MHTPKNHDLATSGACLLLHGFAGTPFEVRPVQTALIECGIPCHTPTLPGHDATLDEFKKSTFADWYGAAEREYLALRAEYAKVVVAGFSLGSSLALLLAARHSPEGVVALSPPYGSYLTFARLHKNWRLLALPVLKYFLSTIPTGTANPASREIAPFEGYEGVQCLAPLDELMRGLGSLPQELGKIRCPALLMQDYRDKRLPPTNALSIALRLRSEDITLRYTTIREKVTSHHLITTHRETRALVGQEVCAFATRVLGTGETR